MTPPNLYASAVLLRGRGVLILGASGSGKTRLALRLAAEPDGILVADDQVLLRCEEGLVHADAPEAIAGLAEVRGFGPVSVPFAPSCPLSLVVHLVPAAEAPRLRPESSTETLCGNALPSLPLAERDAEGAALAIKAWLFGSPF